MLHGACFHFSYPQCPAYHRTSTQGGSVALQTRPDARIAPIQQFCALPGREPHPPPPHIPQLGPQITSPDLGRGVGEEVALIESVGLTVPVAVAVVDMLGVADAVHVADADMLGVADAVAVAVADMLGVAEAVAVAVVDMLGVADTVRGAVGDVPGDGVGDLDLRGPRLQHHHPSRPLDVVH